MDPGYKFKCKFKCIRSMYIAPRHFFIFQQFVISICILLTSASVLADSEYFFNKANEYSLQHDGRTFLVLKDGKIEYEAYGPGYSKDTATDIHSATKSFWCSAVAAMVDDGLVKSLDERMADTISEWQGKGSKSLITLRQILNLSSGLKPTNPTTDPLRQSNQPDKYRTAINIDVVFDPGSKFFYGPNHYYVLGEFMKRKLVPTNQSPLDYLKNRVLTPIGVNIAKWDHDGSGDPNMPNGAHIKPKDWLRYGQFVLQKGQWNGRQLVDADLIEQCLQPSKANAGYGLTFWLNRPDGSGSLLQGFPQSPPGSRGGFIYPDDFPDLAMAGGAGINRMYVIPSLNMVIIRQAKGQTLSGFEDSNFLGLLFSGAPGTEPTLKKTRFTGNPVIAHPGQKSDERGQDLGRLAPLDRNNDGRVSRNEIPQQAKRLNQNFERIDINGDGFLNSDEITRLSMITDSIDTKEFDQKSSGNGLGRLAPLDRNNDGRVSRNEIPQQAKRLSQNFERIDINGDDFISSEEVARVPYLAVAPVRSKPAPIDQNVKPIEPKIVNGSNIEDIDIILNEMIKRFELAGAGLIVEHNGETLYEKSFGDFSSEKAVPIASATKWFTVAVVMSAVDRGVLKLDDPVSIYLPNFTGNKSNLTIRQCLSFNAGFSDRIPAVWNSNISLRDAVNTIATTPLRTQPGEDFFYGGAGGFHVAGYVAMVALGKDDWNKLFEETIVKPLGLSKTVYGIIQGRTKDRKLIIEPKPGTNPWLGGGAISSLNDYRKFLRMLANNGMYEGRRILSKAAIDEMFSIQTKGLPIMKTLHPVKDTLYGLGSWIESADDQGRGIKVRDMGYWGWNPWIDFERGYFAIIGVHDDMYRLWESEKNIEDIIDKVLDSSGNQVTKVTDTELRTLNWQNLERSYLIYAPEETRPDREMPLVIMLHAGKSNAKEWIERTNWPGKADNEGFIVAAPNAVAIRTGNGRSITTWNDGSGRNIKSDDIGFIKAMINEIVEKHPVDRSRIYLTGVGSGASLTYLAGVALSDQVAAIAPVSGHLWKEVNKFTSPVSLISIIGTEDPINPVKAGKTREMTGQPGRFKPPVRDSVARWVAALGLASTSRKLTLGSGVTGEQFGPAKDGREVVFYMIDGIGHGWPGDVESLTFSGKVKHANPPIDATDVIWAFFSRHSK